MLRIHIPPLRERPEDVPILADQFVARLARRTGRSVEPLDRATLAALGAYAWPGNVRELENTLERALILARGGPVTSACLPFASPGPAPAAAAPSVDAAPAPLAPIAAESEDLSIKRRGRALEQRLIRLALARTRGNRTRAAELLELSARALQYKLKEYAIDPLNPVPPGSDI